MKQILYPLLAATFALGLLLPVGIFAAQDSGAVCSVQADTPCFVKEGDSYRSLTEDVPQNEVSQSGRGGQLELVVVHTPQLQTDKRAAREHPKAD